jgi:hypothetical protein
VSIAAVHSSGIQILGPAATRVPLHPNLTRAWTDALLLSEVGDGLGYPWADGATGTLVLSVTNPTGQLLASQWITSGFAHRNPKVGTLAKPAVPVQVRTVALSYTALEGIKLDATRLETAGLPDADAIYEAAPDWEQNRIVLTVSRRSDALVNALAARYGTAAVAIRVEPRPVTVPTTRTHDYSWFYGGAIIDLDGHGCSSGFSWTDGATDYILTAGHCAAGGATTATTTDAGRVYVDTIGTNGAVTPNTRENWTNWVGTKLMTGDSTYRGDVALIRVDANKGVSPYIYSGAWPDETTAAAVRSMWTTVPVAGEQYCTGGSNTYALCGWGVDLVRINYRYSTTGEWALNVTKGLKNFGTSTNSGDSGGPVYTVNTDGTIQAKGIHSGGTAGPASCSEFSKCVQIFTDILLPYWGFPGWPKTL